MADRPVLGVLGGGQLGRMLALAAYPLDIETRLFDPAPDACGGQVASLTSAGWDDLDAVRRWAERCDAVTYEFENVPEAVARAVMEVAPLRPGVEALVTAQDRVLERELFARCGIATPRWVKADSAQELAAAVDGFPLPAIVKARRGGYDGKGQGGIASVDDAARVFAELGSVPVIVDERVAFDREVSVVAARSGMAIAAYPAVVNAHHAGILVRTDAAAGLVPGVAGMRAMERVAAALDYCGVLAVEFFDVGGALLANEFAPRVHNTGHWTMDGAATGQFEQHVRAVMGLPLGAAEPVHASVMVNLIGGVPTRAVLAACGGRVHLYGKSMKPGRKVGHVTFVGAGDAAGTLLGGNRYSEA
ncbi:MAG: 5-(carboxyamino)imidazole ribonucleotide synthase [Planctomycetota bacterium]